MAVKWKCPEKKILKDWINALGGNKKLLPWENNFVKSLQSQLEWKDELSQTQVAILERLYAENTN